MSASICLAVVLVFLWALPAGTQRAHPERSARGCSDAGLCCPRRDMRCASQGRRTDGSLGPCFCDAACSRVGDCCADYDDTCPASLCKVSQWSHWSGCALPCSPSYRERVRSVLQHPRGSAPECPALRQRAVCMTDHSLSGLPCSFSLRRSTVWSSRCSPCRLFVAGQLRQGSIHAGYSTCIQVSMCVFTASHRQGVGKAEANAMVTDMQHLARCRCGGIHLVQQVAKDYGDDLMTPTDATVPHNIHCSLYELVTLKPFPKGQLCDLIQRVSAQTNKVELNIAHSLGEIEQSFYKEIFVFFYSAARAQVTSKSGV
uniref:somatomedin-B and thrombospondin type-1 domain-containing protein-like isoform X1 n=1 Tax=Myxine glutinosa TaxID=7769 RepID=UPI00358F2C3F